jgi:hypothetical protein
MSNVGRPRRAHNVELPLRSGTDITIGVVPPKFGMRTLKTLLIFVSLLSGLASAFLCFWWIPIFASLFIHWDISSPIDEALAAYASSNFKLLLFLFREYFAAIVGLPGWIALFALCLYAQRDWRNLPKWIPVGCLFGAASALAGPYHFSLAIPPISLAISVLILVKLKAEAPSTVAQ